MYIMFKVESVALKKSQSLCLASKEKFLKSDDVKSTDESMMKINDETLLMEVRMKVRVFLGDSLNKNIPRKKIA